MIRALIEAAAGASAAIAILLWIALRRFRDVLLTLVPLMAAALATLEICALTGFELNYANIIAFPVLLGVGVAFRSITSRPGGRVKRFLAIRAHPCGVLQRRPNRHSLWQPGTVRQSGLSSMGKLLALPRLHAHVGCIVPASLMGRRA